MLKKPIATSLIFVTAFVACSCAAVEFGPMQAPPDTLSDQKTMITPDRTPGFFSDYFQGIMTLYNNVLKPGISRGCPCDPSCSVYMQLAVTHYGLPMGLILGLERLLHETGEIHHGTFIQKPHGWRVYDPLTNNTFWWDTSVYE